MDLQEILESPPLVHDYGGRLVSWPLPAEVQHFISRRVDPNSRTLETGAGASTVLFAALGATHTCISPDRDEVGRIREYCRQRGVSLAKVEFHIDRSDRELMRSAAQRSYRRTNRRTWTWS